MHEFGVASEVWEAVKSAVSRSLAPVNCASRSPAPRVTAITIELGELNLIEDEQLRFWVTALAERDGSPKVDLRISHIPIRLRCRRCGEESAVELAGRQPGLFLPPSLECPQCGSRDVEAIGGREIRVVSAEVSTEPSIEQPDARDAGGIGEDMQ